MRVISSPFSHSSPVRGQLRCYVCENCPDPFEGTSAQLQACPASESTTTTQMPPGGDTTILTPPPLPTGDGSGQQTTTTLAATTEAPPTPSTPVITPPPVVGRRKRQTAATGYRCFRIEHCECDLLAECSRLRVNAFFSPSLSLPTSQHRPPGLRRLPGQPGRHLPVRERWHQSHRLYALRLGRM